MLTDYRRAWSYAAARLGAELFPAGAAAWMEIAAETAREATTDGPDACERLFAALCDVTETIHCGEPINSVTMIELRAMRDACEIAESNPGMGGADAATWLRTFRAHAPLDDHRLNERRFLQGMDMWAESMQRLPASDWMSRNGSGDASVIADLFCRLVRDRWLVATPCGRSLDLNVPAGVAVVPPTPPRPKPTPAASVPAGPEEFERVLRETVDTLTPDEARLAWLMHTYADVDGRNIDPGPAQLARVLDWPPSRVRTLRARLVLAGWLRKTECGGGQVASTYALAVPYGLADACA